MTGTEARKLSDAQLKTQLKDLRMQQFQLRQKKVTEKVENTAQFREIRKDIARLLTETNARRHAKAGAASKK